MLEFRPESWYEPDFIPEDKNVEIINESKALLSSIVKRLYNRESLDLGRLESELDEFCYLLNLPIDYGTLQVKPIN